MDFTAEELRELATTLGWAESHLRAVDQSNADANLADIRLRPLTRAVSDSAAMVRVKMDLID